MISGLYFPILFAHCSQEEEEKEKAEDVEEVEEVDEETLLN